MPQSSSPKVSQVRWGKPGRDGTSFRSRGFFRRAPAFSTRSCGSPPPSDPTAPACLGNSCYRNQHKKSTQWTGITSSLGRSDGIWLGSVGRSCFRFGSGLLVGSDGGYNTFQHRAATLHRFWPLKVPLSHGFCKISRGTGSHLWWQPEAWDEACWWKERGRSVQRITAGCL